MKHVVLICATMLVWLASPAMAEDSPAASVRYLQNAIETMDMDLASTYLDFDTFIQNVVAEATTNTNLLKQASENPIVALILAGLNDDAGTRQAVRAILAQEARNFVTYGIRSGAFAGKHGAGANQGDPGLFGNAFRGNERDIKRLGEARLLEKKGNIARVAASLYDGMSKKSYPLEFGLSLENNIWKIKELRNLKTLMPGEEKL